MRGQQNADALLPSANGSASSSSMLACGSRPLVGSSRMATRASFMTISARPSRWRMPREKVATFLSATSLKPTRASAAAMRFCARRRTQAHQPRGVVQVVGGGEVVVEADRIRQIADPALDRQRLAHRIVPEHARLPAADVAQAEQHQDGGGLAGAVRARAGRRFRRRATLKVDAIDGGRRRRSAW